MTDVPENETANLSFDIIKAFGPGLIALIFAVFMKPFNEWSKVAALRKSFLGTVRFRMSCEVAKILPEKDKNVSSGDYVEICAAKLNDYFSTNSEAIVDFLNSEKIYKSYVTSFRWFKYGIVAIPIFLILCGVILFLSFRHILTVQNFCFGTIILVLLIGVLWALKERKKDQYGQLCSKYEVVE